MNESSEAWAINQDITANPVWVSAPLPPPALRPAVVQKEDLLAHYQALVTSWAAYAPQL